jgi:hypothetical protein
LRPLFGTFFGSRAGRTPEFGLNWGCIDKYTPLEWASPPPRQNLYKDGEFVEGYCLKDKRKVEMKDPQPITMKNGKPATVGTCPFCGTKIYKIGKAS